MTALRVWPLFIACLTLAACGGEDASPPDGGDGGRLDGSSDSTVSDAATDAGPDTGVDASADAGVGPLSAVHFIGRFEVTGADDARFAWPGSAIAARFDGTEISVTLEDAGENFFDVAIDGEMVDVLEASSGSATYALASGLPAGPHDVVITRRTESFAGMSRFMGFAGSPLVPTPAPTRFIEMVGDSITCGYGVLGVGPGCSFSLDTEAETHAWGALAATDLGAAHAAIAYSGKGVIRNYGGDTTEPLPALYDRVFASNPGVLWDFTGYSPDIVVVNLGTNDYSTGEPGTPFDEGLTTFVETIRSHHAEALVLLATSPMLSGADHTAHRAHLEAVITSVGDPRVQLLDLATQRSEDGYGCDYHPSEPTQRIMADALVTRIRELTDW